MSGTPERIYKYVILIEEYDEEDKIKSVRTVFESDYLTLKEVDEKITEANNANDLYSRKFGVQLKPNQKAKVEIQHFYNKEDKKYRLVEPVLFSADNMVLDEEETKRKFSINKYNPIVVKHFLENFSIMNNPGLKNQIISIYTKLGMSDLYIPPLNKLLDTIDSYWASRRLYITNRAYERMEFKEAQIEHLLTQQEGHDYVSQRFDLEDVDSYPEGVFDGSGKKPR